MMSEKIRPPKGEKPDSQEPIALPDRSHETINPPESTDVVPVADDAADAAPESVDAPEQAAEKKRFVSRREGAVQKFLVVDESADPANSIIEPGTGERLREATPEELKEAIRMIVAKDPEGPRPFRDANLPEKKAQTTPETKPKTADAVKPEAAEESKPDETEELIRKLQKKTPEERKKIIGKLTMGGGGEKPPSGGEAPAKNSEPDEEPEAAVQEKEAFKYNINHRDYVGIKLKTLQEILADPVHQQFFGELVHTMEPNAEDVLRRLHEDRTTPADETFLNYATKEYSKWDRAWSDLTEHMSEHDVEIFKRRNQHMDNVIQFVGKENALSNFKQMLRYLAMRDQEAFEHIEHALHHAHEVNHSMLGEIANKRIDKLSEEIGIDRTEFEDVFKLSSKKDEAETRQRLTQRFHNQAGSGRKAMDWLSSKIGTPLVGSSGAAADSAINKAKLATGGYLQYLTGLSGGPTGKKFEALNSHLDHAAPLLNKVMGDEALRRKVVREVKTNEAHRVGMEAGPASFPAAKEAIEKIPEADIQKNIEQVIKSDPKWETGGRAYQDSVLRDMKRSETKKLKSGTGFWSWLMRVVFGTKFDTAATKATGRPVHVH